MDAPTADTDADVVAPPVTTPTRLISHARNRDDWVQTWSRMFQRLLDKFLRETYGHVVSVQLLAAASTALLLSCALYFLSPLLEDDYHMYERYVPWVYYLDYSKYNSFIVDHVVVFLAISLPMGWLLLVNVTYSGVATRLDLALLLLRVACCLTVCASLTVILTEFLSRRVMIALLSLAYGALGLVYAWSVPLWRWYLDDASTKGLIAFLPASVQELLLRTSLLEWLTDTTLTERVQPFLPFLLPLSRAEQNRLLERMPVEQQLTLTRPGLLPFLPETVQRALLPTAPANDEASAEQQLVVANADFSSRASVTTVTKRELPPTADAGFGFHRPDVVNSSALAKQSSEEVLADIISTRVWKYVARACGCDAMGSTHAWLTHCVSLSVSCWRSERSGCKQIVQMPSSKTLNRTASVSTALFVLQVQTHSRLSLVCVCYETQLTDRLLSRDVSVALRVAQEPSDVCHDAPVPHDVGTWLGRCVCRAPAVRAARKRAPLNNEPVCSAPAVCAAVLAQEPQRTRAAREQR